MQGTILISGVSRGIGRGLAEAYLRDGWSVIGTVRDATRPPAIFADALGAGRLRLFEADMRDAGSLAAIAGALDEPLDVLIASAGIMGERTADTLHSDPAAYAEVFDVNVLGPLRLVQAFHGQLARAARERGRARVLAISSIMGSLSIPKSNAMPYRASKAALNKLARGLATDLSPQDIFLATCHPGWVKTEMGGDDAEIGVEQSVRGLMTLVEKLGPATAGGFWNYDGGRMEW